MTLASWSDDRSFWDAMAPLLCAPARLALADGDVDALLRGLGLPRPASILDLGSGPGAHAIACAERGHRVTGVDASATLLAHARRAAGARGVDVEWVEADMRRFRRPGAFDLALSLYSSFGYFDDDDNRVVLGNVRASLAPGGVAVIDVISAETIAGEPPGERRVELDGTRWCERRRVDGEPLALVGRWTISRGAEVQEFDARQRLYTAPELRGLLDEAGFGDVQLFGDLGAARPFDAGATRLVAVARRG